MWLCESCKSLKACFGAADLNTIFVDSRRWDRSRRSDNYLHFLHDFFDLGGDFTATFECAEVLYGRDLPALRQKLLAPMSVIIEAVANPITVVASTLGF